MAPSFRRPIPLSSVGLGSKKAPRRVNGFLLFFIELTFLVQVENAYRFQLAGFKDEIEYKAVMEKGI